MRSPSSPPNSARKPPPRRAEEFDIEFVLGTLLEAKLISTSDAADVRQSASNVKARLLRSRTEGERRKFYEVSPIEIIALYNFPMPGRPGVSLDEEVISERVARAAGLEYRKIDPLKLDMALVSRTLSGPYAERHSVLPLEWAGGKLVVAVANPFDTAFFESMTTMVGAPVEVRLAAKSEILKAVDHAYGFNRSVTLAADLAATGPSVQNFEQLVQLATGARELDADERPVVSAVEYLLRYAFDQRASDIHVEPRRDSSLVRMRIDGVLHPVHTLPAAAHAPMVSRIKTLARMDIAEKRRPQDGRIKTARKDQEVELRVSTLPTAFGEKVVMRVFDPEVAVVGLEELGFDPIEHATFRAWIERPHGIILVTGPTGSGKTTTLYAALKALARPEVNVTTIEDPIEIVHELFNQTQVQPKIDLDFAAALRHILRQDPDIIMLGEIRDKETAVNAVQAALTGHLVLSTLHTNSASEAVTRLVDLGVLPFLVAGSLIGIMAQRLLRNVCPHCAEPVTLSDAELARLGVPIAVDNAGQGPRRGTGCNRCRNTGYLGRSGAFEMLSASTDVQEHIARGSRAATIEQIARAEGMRTLREAAAAKVELGVTTVEEALRVTALAPT